MGHTFGSQKYSLSYRAKRAVVRTSLLALGAAFETVSKYSTELKAAIADWEDDYVFSIGVLPEGPAISLTKQPDRIRYLGKGYKNTNLRILFKNIDAAFLGSTGRMGSHTATAQHRSIVHGNLAETLRISRAMNIVQAYVYPGFMLKKTMKRPPTLAPAQLVLKAYVVATLPIGMLLKARR